MRIIPVLMQDKIAVLKQNPYFKTLEESAVPDLAPAVSLLRHDPGEITCWQEETGTGLYIIHRGSGKLFKLSRRGRELIIHVLDEGSTFNEVSVFDRGANPINAAALEASEIWTMEQEAIQQALSSHPDQGILKEWMQDLS